MEECTQLIQELKNILKNLKKAPNRKYKRSTLKNKTNRSRELYNDTLQLAELLDEKTQKIILSSARSTLGDIISFINHKLEFKTLTSFRSIGISIRAFLSLYSKNRIQHTQNSPNMAKVDIRLGTSLIPVYDGNSDGLDMFLDSALFFIDYINTENAQASPEIQETAKKLAARFLKTRLSGIAHQIVQSAETTEDILSSLKLHCASKENSDNLLTKLKLIRQNQSLQSFCNEVENICIKLKNAYIKESIPLTKANEMTVKIGVDTLINGITNPETRLILKAGTFTTLNDAVQKALGNDTTNTQENRNILFTVNRSNNNNRYNNRNNNRQNYNNNNRQNSYNNNRQYHNNNNRHNSNNNNNNNNRQHNPNYYNRGNSNRNYRNNTDRNNYPRQNNQNNNRSTNWRNGYRHQPISQQPNNNVFLAEVQETQTSDIQQPQNNFLDLNQRQSTR